MSELFSKLGIDWRLLVAQLANFLILLFVLRRFAYKPLLKLLEERKQKIAIGLANAQKAKSNLEAKQRAEELQKQRVALDDMEYAKTAALMEKELARVKVARKHRTRHEIKID